jgi:hypothetical protein
MSITLNLSPELEAKIRLVASSSGKSVEGVVADSLAERFAAQEPDRSSELSPDEWNSKLDQLLKNLPHTTAVSIDTSRVSIYGDEGR